jgi:DNA-binding transcriptional ArsR family regulator
MTKTTGKTKSPDSRRALVSSSMSATAHPTRELILRTLKAGPQSTLDLEKVTGENRYNLYHHLSVLEDVPLITSSIGEGRRKVFELNNPKRPEVAFIVLDSRDKEEAKVLKKTLKLLDEETEEGVPHRRDIRRAKMVFYYPWSSEE